MELHQVRYFLALANTPNFTLAAEMCNVTQPAPTKGVQKLEHELGGALLYRERQLTHLTELGKAVLPTPSAQPLGVSASRLSMNCPSNKRFVSSQEEHVCTIRWTVARPVDDIDFITKGHWPS